MKEASEDDSQPDPTKKKQIKESTAIIDSGEQIHSKPSDNAPPLPKEDIPTLLVANNGPGDEDDGWAPVWDPNARAYYFFNRFSQKTQWENPRIPEATAASSLNLRAEDTKGDNSAEVQNISSKSAVAGGYNPAIHGDYDPNADYARDAAAEEENTAGNVGHLDGATAYAAAASFNRYTGKWQDESLKPENFNDENKSRRQLNAYFDVDAAANTHDGRSLKAERAGKKLSKKEVKAFREKRREKKEERRRAWLKD